ncbi:MAG: DUF4395 domain-containing protein [Desulfobacteraceae bacterium]|jgi:hypothetical protein
MEKFCPISLNRINERTAQCNAAAAVLFTLLFFFTPLKWVLWILSIDFFIRGFLNPAYSFFSAASKTLLRIFNVKPIMVNAGPKIFAAQMGFIFTCIINISYLLDFQSTSYTIASIFIFFATLEAILRFCVACRLYPFIHKFKIP